MYYENDNKIIYLNYWSRLRSNCEDIEKEKEFNNGRVATKKLFKGDYEMNDKQNGFYILTRDMWYLHHKFIRIAEPYTSFQIPKHSGGMRTITAPVPELKEIQKTIVKDIYKSKWLASNNAHGFTKGRNCKTSLQVHQKHKSRWFLKIDIHDFFGSTTREMIVKALSENAPFCTMSESIMNQMAEICTHNGVVPQGAPTSPVICNIVMNSYDYKIQNYCHKHSLIYTRYADDILISSRVKWDYTETLAFIQKVLSPYTISEHKTRFGSFNGRNWNLGIMYTNDYKLTVGHKRKHDLKCAVHNYVTKPEVRSDEAYYKLQGTLAYCKYIEPDYEWFSWAELELGQFKPQNPPVAHVPLGVTVTTTETEMEEMELPFI